MVSDNEFHLLAQSVSKACNHYNAPGTARVAHATHRYDRSSIAKNSKKSPKHPKRKTPRTRENQMTQKTKDPNQRKAPKVERPGHTSPCVPVPSRLINPRAAIGRRDNRLGSTVLARLDCTVEIWVGGAGTTVEALPESNNLRI